MPISTDDGNSHVSKRRRTTSERMRVTRACDRCKKRKIKCDGSQPCAFCSRASAECTFDSAYARGRVPSILPAYDTETGSTSAQAEDILNLSNSPSVSMQENPALPTTEPVQQNARSLSDNFPPNHLPPPASAYAVTSLQASPEPCQTDLQGHYIGPASGVSFLLKIQKRLDESISFSDPSSIFTFGDAPLQPPDFDPSFCLMLPKNDAQRLVDRYFDFAMPTYRFLHRPTIQEWFVEFYDTLGSMHGSHAAPAKLALLFMVFAQARVYMPDNDKPGPSDMSARYYLAAENQLTRERGVISLTSVQARLLQCIYLLTQSRINHCWNLFGTVSRLALGIGLNRKDRRPDPPGGLGKVEVECRRRSFWCAYTLDTFLSAALGRPRSFHDDDIDAALPAMVEDHELMIDNFTTPTMLKSQSVMLAPLAHIKLARIISMILHDIYSIKPISASRRAILITNVSKELNDWRTELARFLDVDYLSSSLLIPIYQRQRNVLNLTYWHALILAYRPFVLSNFTRHSQHGRGRSEQDPQTEESVQQCLKAAMNTVNTIDEITQDRQMFRAFWITAYFAFTATIVLYMYVIQKRAFPPEVYARYFLAAARCQSHIWAIAEKGSLSERYCLVLEELRIEALRRTASTQSSTMDISGQPQQHGLHNSTVPINGSLNDALEYLNMTGQSPLDFDGMTALSDSVDWDQFASMISAGLGNLDTFLTDA